MRSIEKQKEFAYRHLCFKYGVIALCYLIDQYSEDEDYEECQIILNAIKGLSAKYDIELPTKFDEKAKKWLKRELITITDTDGETIINNTPYYANLIREELKQMTSL